MISERLPVVLAVCAGLSLVPIIGLIPGVIYYRLAVVAPYRRYVSRGRALLLRWLVRIVAVFLIMIQWIPGVGMITLPILALISYSTYRRAFHGQVRYEAMSGTTPSPDAAPAATASGA